MSKKLPIWIEKEEFIQLIKATKQEKYKLAFLLGYGSGMRISEIVDLTPNNVMLKDKRIMIKKGKGGKDRVVPLPKGFKDKHIKMLPLKVGVRAIQQAFYVSATKSRLIETKPGIHFHSLRHGFATELLSKGVPINYVQVLLGHTYVSTTSIYTHANPKDALKSYEELF